MYILEISFFNMFTSISIHKFDIITIVLLHYVVVIIVHLRLGNVKNRKSYTKYVNKCKIENLKYIYQYI